MKPSIPKALKYGHENLLLEIKDLISLEGNVGEKAEKLYMVMSPHFEKEEKYALPPLGLLLTLSEGSWEIDAEEAIRMSDMLKEKLSEFKKEHENIDRALQNLKIAAEEEDNYNAKQFVKDLLQHVEIEDQVLYPATILVGNYLKKMRE